MLKNATLAGIVIISIIASCFYKKPKMQLAGQWCNLERDTTGYVNYYPCESEANSIEIKNNKVIMKWQIEDPDTLKIINLQQSETDKYRVECKGRNYSFLINIRWIDKAHTLALWKFHASSNFFPDFKWVMCPAKNKGKFPVVRCITNDTIKMPEHLFLPINLY